eukprot:snap_masked-scaffold_81-processed-gene-0.16-mRNA-1 protein AED:1.00 eAED:1.00 QI:0/-1/0/0/-1/1/1/0/126
MKHSFKSVEPPSNYILKLFTELKKTATECNTAPSKHFPSIAKTGLKIPAFNTAHQNVRFRSKTISISLQEGPRLRNSKEYTVEKIGDAEQPDQASSLSICTVFSIFVLYFGQFSNDQIQATRFKDP